MIYEIKLDELAYTNITRADYPEPTPTSTVEISAKTRELADLKSGKIIRPQPKSAYFAVLAQLEDDISILKTQNAEITALNRAAIRAVDEAYDADLEAYKADPINQWVALSFVVAEKLRDSEWMMMVDSQLSFEQTIIATTYRDALMSLKLTYETPEQAISNMPTNPFDGVWK